jgi:hypothetical protein
MTELEEFQAIVLEHPEYCDRLLAETDDERFFELVAGLVAEAGFSVRPEEVRTALRVARQSWMARRIR